MARPLRLEFAGALYHLTSRGNAQADIFLDDADRRIFLRLLGTTISRYKWRLYAYCLMGNHYHLFAETALPNVSRGMRHLNGCYTQAFNRRHSRVGHVLQGRFDGILVERESHFLEVARYVALNPVRAKLVRSAREWPWSSFRATAGMEGCVPWLTIAPLLSMYGDDAGVAAERYVSFVEDGIGHPAPWKDLKGQILLGSEAFADRMRPLLEQHAGKQETPKAQRLAARPELEVLLPSGQSKPVRNAAIAEAHRSHGYTLAEIATHVGLHYSTVSRIAQGADSEMKDLTPAFQVG
jgi:putative transposase